MKNSDFTNEGPGDDPHRLSELKTAPRDFDRAIDLALFECGDDAITHMPRLFAVEHNPGNPGRPPGSPPPHLDPDENVVAEQQGARLDTAAADHATLPQSRGIDDITLDLLQHMQRELPPVRLQLRNAPVRHGSPDQEAADAQVTTATDRRAVGKLAETPMLMRAVVTIIIRDRRDEIIGKELHQCPVNQTWPNALQAAQCALGSPIELELAIAG